MPPLVKGKGLAPRSTTTEPTDTLFSEPGAAVACYFNSIFGRARNWPRAYNCLSPAARNEFGSEHGLRAFADYWEDKLSFLEEIVKIRHGEFPYTHRTCFTLDRVERRELAGDRAVFAVELVENHVAAERLKIAQTKIEEKHGETWLLANGKLEGNLDDIITVNSRRARGASKNAAAGESSK